MIQIHYGYDYTGTPVNVFSFECKIYIILVNSPSASFCHTSTYILPPHRNETKSLGTLHIFHISSFGNATLSDNIKVAVYRDEFDCPSIAI